MKIRILITVSILVLAVLVIGNSCTTTPRTQEIFFNSVGSGDYAEVKRLIEEGADVNAKNKEGYTALMRASGWGSTSRFPPIPRWPFVNLP